MYIYFLFSLLSSSALSSSLFSPPLLFQLQCKQMFSLLSIQCYIFNVFVLFLGEGECLHYLKWNFECGPEVLSSVPKCEKDVMCLTQKVHVHRKQMSFVQVWIREGALGCEFNVSKSMDIKYCVLKRNTYKARLCIDKLTNMQLEFLRNLTPYFPKSHGSVFSSSVFVIT